MTREEAIQFLDNMKHEEAGRAIGKDGFYAELMGYHVEALNMAIKALEQEPKWIPVSERLPEERKSVLVYAPEYKNIYCAYLDGDTWFIFGSYGSYAVANVIAWMPLPEPYKSESEG